MEIAGAGDISPKAWDSLMRGVELNYSYRMGVEDALAILHDTGWVGSAEQRIQDLISPRPKGDPKWPVITA